MSAEFIEMADEFDDEWELLEDRVAGRLPQKSPFESSLQEAGRVRREIAQRRSDRIYRRPLPRGSRPSLVTRLERAPRTALVHPFENQVSEILGFLIDNDDRFARDLVDLMWSQSTPAVPFWPTQARSIGAFQGGTLPGAGLAPVLYPDISICGEAPDFQVLVEVKVTADFHGYPDADGSLVLQPDAYARAWESVSGGLPVERRRVSTIASKAPASPESRHPARGRDLSWEADVIPLILDLAVRRGPLDDYLGVVALDLATAIRTRLAPPSDGPRGRTPSAEFPELSQFWRGPFSEALRLLEESRPGELAPGALAEASDYLGSYIAIATPHCEVPARVWVFLTTADGKYNREGQAASACVCLWEPGPRKCPELHDSLRGGLGASGARRADRSQETACRVYRALTAFDEDAMRAPQLALWIEQVLVEAGLVGPAPRI